MAGYSWRRVIEDDNPFPGITVRKISLELRWQEEGRPKWYRSETYVVPK